MVLADIENETELKDLLDSNKHVIVKFSAKWCSPCKRIHPKFVEMSNNRTNVEFVHIDFDVAKDICEQYEVKSLPTFILFVDGKERHRFSGASEVTLNNMLKMCDE